MLQVTRKTRLSAMVSAAAALRWAVIGILYGTANAGLDRLFPDPRQTPFLFLLRNALPLLAGIGAYLLVFRLPKIISRRGI